MSEAQWSGEAKYRALLAVAEAANSRRDLSSVLDAVATALEGLVPIDAIGVMTREGDRIQPLAVHSRNEPRRDDESNRAYARRLIDMPGPPYEPPPNAEVLDRLEKSGETLVVDDVPRDLRFAGFAAVKRTGVEGLVLSPLAMGEEFIGGIAFARLTRTPFRPDEVRILEDVSRPVATAVANALAFEEIRARRARLEDENRALQEEIDTFAAAGGIIGASDGLRVVLERVERVAGTDSTVLISGETGTGKELVAHAIHRGSRRAERPLIKVNGAALAEGLVASELFGHEKGAFTGALERRRGRFELAAGGTIFLDEVGDLPPAVQVALLRVLQEGEFERVGGSQTLRTDARVVAATNRNLEEAVREGRLRSDLYFRLNVFPIHVPPLRERADDIPLIAEYYAHHYGRKLGKLIRGIALDALARLREYRWPGNVRELQNVVERAVILARRDLIEPADLEIPAGGADARARAAVDGGPETERRHIEAALASSRAGSRAPTARRRPSGCRPARSSPASAGSGSTSTRSADAPEAAATGEDPVIPSFEARSTATSSLRTSCSASAAGCPTSRRCSTSVSSRTRRSRGRRRSRSRTPSSAPRSTWPRRR